MCSQLYMARDTASIIQNFTKDSVKSYYKYCKVDKQLGFHNDAKQHPEERMYTHASSDV